MVIVIMKLSMRLFRPPSYGKQPHSLWFQDVPNMCKIPYENHGSYWGMIWAGDWLSVRFICCMDFIATRLNLKCIAWLLGLTSNVFLIAEIHRKWGFFFLVMSLEVPRAKDKKRFAVWDARALCAPYFSIFNIYFNIWEYHSCFSPHFRWLFSFSEQDGFCEVRLWDLRPRRWGLFPHRREGLERHQDWLLGSDERDGWDGKTPFFFELYPLVNIQKAMENHHFQWENPLFLWPFSIAMLVHQRVLSIRFFPSHLQHPTTSTTIQFFETLSHVDSSHIAPVRFGQSKPQLLFHPWDACILRLHPWSFIYLPRWRRCLENCVLLLTQMFGFKRLMVVGKQEPHNSKSFGGRD